MRAADSLIFDHQIDLHIFGRNCDRSVEWSSPFEQIDQTLALLLAYTFHPKTQIY